MLRLPSFRHRAPRVYGMCSARFCGMCSRASQARAPARFWHERRPGSLGGRHPGGCEAAIRKAGEVSLTSSALLDVLSISWIKCLYALCIMQWMKLTLGHHKWIQAQAGTAVGRMRETRNVAGSRGVRPWFQAPPLIPESLSSPVAVARSSPQQQRTSLFAGRDDGQT